MSFFELGHTMIVKCCAVKSLAMTDSVVVSFVIFAPESDITPIDGRMCLALALQKDKCFPYDDLLSATPCDQD